MDQDGANAEFLLPGFAAVINPRYSPTEERILYGAYVPDPKYPKATLLRTYLYDVATGRQEILSEGPNSLDYSARFSPDGKSIALSRAVGGNSDIYIIELARLYLEQDGYRVERYVIEVLPNGNLLISGEKQVAIGHEQEFVRVSGVVNPRFVDASNTVPSSKIADARIEYKSAGQIADAEIIGWLARFFLSVLPF